MQVLKAQDRFIKFCLTIQCHERKLLSIFLAQISYTLDKISHQSKIFGLLSGWVKMCTKVLMSYLKPQVNFSLNFASLFKVMRDESSVRF